MVEKAEEKINNVNNFVNNLYNNQNIDNNNNKNNNNKNNNNVKDNKIDNKIDLNKNEGEKIKIISYEDFELDIEEVEKSYTYGELSFSLSLVRFFFLFSSDFFIRIRKLF